MFPMTFSSIINVHIRFFKLIFMYCIFVFIIVAGHHSSKQITLELVLSFIFSYICIGEHFLQCIVYGSFVVLNVGFNKILFVLIL